MRFIFAILSFTISAFASGCPGCEEGDVMSFEQWTTKYRSGRTFSLSQFGLSEEDSTRRANFAKNIEMIKAHNAKYAKGEESYKMGVNQFSDMSFEEFKTKILGGFKVNEEVGDRTYHYNKVSANAESVDWRTKGAVTPVKNQGQCGSCWAFSTTGALEGAVAVETGSLISLAERQLVECDNKSIDSGCNGGLPEYAMKYIVKNGGMDSEDDYPYRATGGVCKKDKEARHVVSISGYKLVPQSDAEQMKAALNLKPVSVAVDANGFFHYNGGVLKDVICSDSLNHAVLAVGYTSEHDREFPNAWIVKNSWGETWGKNGYVYMDRSTKYGRNGLCGVLKQGTYATGASVPGPHPAPTPASTSVPTPAPRPTTPRPTNSPRPTATPKPYQPTLRPTQTPAPTYSPGTTFYESPFEGACHGQEFNVTTGHTKGAKPDNKLGSICAPECGHQMFFDCPSVPKELYDAGVTAAPMCMVFGKQQHKAFCGLACSPNGPNQKCGPNMKCQLGCDTLDGQCTYMCLYNYEDSKKKTVTSSAQNMIHRLSYLSHMNNQ